MEIEYTCVTSNVTSLPEVVFSLISCYMHIKFYLLGQVTATIYKCERNDKFNHVVQLLQRVVILVYFWFQIEYLNDYNELVRERIGDKLKDNSEAYEWMMSKTEPYFDINPQPTSAANSVNSLQNFYFIVCVFILCLV